MKIIMSPFQPRIFCDSTNLECKEKVTSSFVPVLSLSFFPIPSSAAQRLLFLHRQKLSTSPWIYWSTHATCTSTIETYLKLLILICFSLTSRMKTRSTNGHFETFWCIFSIFIKDVDSGISAPSAFC